MPFTLAHPALVLPLGRSRLPLAALVAGSLVPDVPLFLPEGLLGSRDEGHSWTHTWMGMAAFCLPMGILLTLLWVYVLQDPLLDGLPDRVRERARSRRRHDRSYWLWSVPAVALGTLSHVGWDQFTHEGTWLSDRWAWLGLPLHGLPTSRWLMYLCSVLGLLAIAVVSWRACRRRRPLPSARVLPQVSQWIISAPLATGCAVAAYRLITVGPYIVGAHALAYHLLTAAMAAAALVLLVLAVAWQIMAPVEVLEDEPVAADHRHLVA